MENDKESDEIGKKSSWKIRTKDREEKGKENKRELGYLDDDSC